MSEPKGGYDDEKPDDADDGCGGRSRGGRRRGFGAKHEGGGSVPIPGGRRVDGAGNIHDPPYQRIERDHDIPDRESGHPRRSGGRAAIHDGPYNRECRPGKAGIRMCRRPVRAGSTLGFVPRLCLLVQPSEAIQGRGRVGFDDLHSDGEGRVVTRPPSGGASGKPAVAPPFVRDQSDRGALSAFREGYLEEVEFHADGFDERDTATREKLRTPKSLSGAASILVPACLVVYAAGLPPVLEVADRADASIPVAQRAIQAA